MDGRAEGALAVALGASAWGVVTSIRIQDFLRRRGRKLNPLLMRWAIFSTVSEYRRLTRRELGHPGTLYSQFTTSWMIALGAALCAALILRFA